MPPNANDIEQDILQHPLQARDIYHSSLNERVAETLGILLIIHANAQLLGITSCEMISCRNGPQDLYNTGDATAHLWQRYRHVSRQYRNLTRAERYLPFSGHTYTQQLIVTDRPHVTTIQGTYYTSENRQHAMCRTQYCHDLQTTRHVIANSNDFVA